MNYNYIRCEAYLQFCYVWHNISTYIRTFFPICTFFEKTCTLFFRAFESVRVDFQSCVVFFVLLLELENEREGRKLLSLSLWHMNRMIRRSVFSHVFFLFKRPGTSGRVFNVFGCTHFERERERERRSEIYRNHI